MRRFVTVLLLSSVLPITPVMAADWRQIGPTVYIDAGSIRQDTFPKFTPNEVHFGPLPATETYRVAWMRFGEQDVVVMVEVVFNCHGGMQVMQQIVSPATYSGPYKSYDLSQDFQSQGVPFKDIAPDTAYDTAQEMVCK